MNSGRDWHGRGMRGPGMWERGGFRPSPPSFRDGFGHRPPAFYPGGPRPWRGPGGPRRGASGGFTHRGGTDKRFGKFGRGGSGARGRGDGKHQWTNQNKNLNMVKDTPGRRLTEEEIGVTEYVVDHAGFNGIIKSRYSDFQVSEINEEGKVAKLTDTSVPEPVRSKEVCEDEELLLCKYNLELLPLETWDKINSLAVSRDPTTERIEVDVTGMTKEERTRIHDAIKKAFGNTIVGSTINTSDKKLVSFEKFRQGVRIDNRVKWVWGSDYLHFIVYKENCDTMEAAAKIAERLMMPTVKPATLGYAGTKDRRAKSSQWFSLRRTEPRRVAAACQHLRELHVGNFTFSDTHLKLGMLRGNRFRIALRNVTAEDDVVNACCENLKAHGFINYYGLQRFGTRVDTPTYSIGLKMLQGKFKESIDEILEPRAGPMQEALATYRETGDAGAAVKFIQRNCHKTLESRLLRSLAGEPNNMVGALDKLARNTRLLYVHSYQSLIWNRCVSHRLRLLGHRPAAGDLVLQEPVDLLDLADGVQDDDSEDEDEKPKTEAAKTDTDKTDTEKTDTGKTDTEKTDTDKTDTEKTDTEKTDTEEKSVPEALISQPVELEAPKETNGIQTATKNHSKKDQVKLKIPVKVLTQEDIDSGKYKFSDIILPLPGCNIDYPPNMRDFYEELLTKDSITLDMKHKHKNYTMSGAYRHIVVQPSELTWECVRYTDPYGDLILSDLDELEGRELNSIIPEGKFKALLLTMSLPSSCYATMALRELLKVNTSGDTQAQQNNYFKEGEPADKGGEGEEKTEANRDDAMVDAESSGREAESSGRQEESNGRQEESNGEAEKRKLEGEATEGSEPKRAKTE